MKCNETLCTFDNKNKEFFNDVNNRIVDLMDPFKESHYIDKDFMGSSSIKKVLPVLVKDLSYGGLGIQDGGTAQRLWIKAFLKGDDSVDVGKLEKDLDEYCALDTLAMVEIYKFLILVR